MSGGALGMLCQVIAAGSQQRRAVYIGALHGACPWLAAVAAVVIEE
jgi:hypothetical protein